MRTSRADLPGKRKPEGSDPSTGLPRVQKGKSQLCVSLDWHEALEDLREVSPQTKEGVMKTIRFIIDVIRLIWDQHFSKEARLGRKQFKDTRTLREPREK